TSGMVNDKAICIQVTKVPTTTDLTRDIPDVIDCDVKAAGVTPERGNNLIEGTWGSDSSSLLINVRPHRPSSLSVCIRIHKDTRRFSRLGLSSCFLCLCRRCFLCPAKTTDVTRGSRTKTLRNPTCSRRVLGPVSLHTDWLRSLLNNAGGDL